MRHILHDWRFYSLTTGNRIKHRLIHSTYNLFHSLLYHFFTMHLLRFLGLTSLALSAQAEPIARNSLSKRCTNSASDRSCWGDYDITTNYYEDGPDTGVTREYWFDITNTTAAPDGVERVILSVNGTVPGPTIIADWGDTIGKDIYKILR